MKYYLLSLYFLIPLLVYGQSEDVINQGATPVKKETKYDKAILKEGIFIRFYDEDMPKLKSDHGQDYNAHIRVVGEDSKSYYFWLDRSYERSNPDRIYTEQAFIEYTDLKEIVKALDKLVKDADVDSKRIYDYIESKYVSSDGFVVGYKKGIDWFMEFDKYRNGIYIGQVRVGVKSVEELVARFQDALIRIEELINN